MFLCPMSKQSFNKFIKQLTADELRNELETVYVRFKNVQQYYALELATEQTDGKVLAMYKQKMLREFFPKKGGVRHGKVSNLNKWIKEFSAVSIHTADVVDIMLYKVEVCIDFLIKYANYSNIVENSWQITFEKVLRIIKENQLVEETNERLLTLQSKVQKHRLNLQAFDNYYKSIILDQ